MPIENTIPVLAAADVSRSITFYRDELGFQLDWGGLPDMPHIASVSCDGHPIMLQRREPAGAGCVWIGGPIQELWHKLRNRPDIKIVQRPTNHPWALDMIIKDPDGNLLWFGTETLEKVPFGTEPVDL